MIRSLKTTIMIAVIYTTLIFTVYPVQGFVADHIDYNIQSNGDAIVTADYTMSLGEKIALMVPTIKDQFAKVIQSEYGDNAKVVSITDSQVIFTIPQYADVTDSALVTPCISFEKIKSRADQYWFMKYMDIDYSPTLTTITFPNGNKSTYDDVMFIPSITSNI
jgi:hypothetical protein